MWKFTLDQTYWFISFHLKTQLFNNTVYWYNTLYALPSFLSFLSFFFLFLSFFIYLIVSEFTCKSSTVQLFPYVSMTSM
jgi:hypothetical protein